MTRLEKFRGYMARLNPAASPALALQEGLYMPRSGRSTADEIAARLEIDPVSSHLVVGGIGSGKTTQLLVARDRLAAIADMHAEYIDVASAHDLDRLEPGILTELAGPHLSERIDSGRQHIVFLFDSLDRLSDPAMFVKVVEQDIRALQKAGIGFVLVGPLASMYGPHRALTDHFQHYYPQLAVDVRDDVEGLSFLVGLLRKRAAEDILPDASALALARWSGGVLRDLISLARAAGEEAYMRGADRVEEAHVETAADAFGRKLAFGLGSADLEILSRVAAKGTFVQTSDRDIALLLTRRVLEHSTGSPRFTVHPTLKPLLAQMAPLPAAS